PSRRRLAGGGRQLPADTSRFEGRFANLYGVLDVVRLGDRLLGIAPTAADPRDELVEFEVVDDDTLLNVSGDGYGFVGERVPYERDAAGTAISIRTLGGMSAWPFDVGDPAAFRPPWPDTAGSG